MYSKIENLDLHLEEPCAGELKADVFFSSTYNRYLLKVKKVSVVQLPGLRGFFQESRNLILKKEGKVYRFVDCKYGNQQNEELSYKKCDSMYLTFKYLELQDENTNLSDDDRGKEPYFFRLTLENVNMTKNKPIIASDTSRKEEGVFAYRGCFSNLQLKENQYGGEDLILDIYLAFKEKQEEINLPEDIDQALVYIDTLYPFLQFILNKLLFFDRMDLFKGNEKKSEIIFGIPFLFFYNRDQQFADSISRVKFQELGILWKRWSALVYEKEDSEEEKSSRLEDGYRYRGENFLNYVNQLNQYKQDILVRTKLFRAFVATEIYVVEHVKEVLLKEQAEKEETPDPKQEQAEKEETASSKQDQAEKEETPDSELEQAENKATTGLKLKKFFKLDDNKSTLDYINKNGLYLNHNKILIYFLLINEDSCGLIKELSKDVDGAWGENSKAAKEYYESKDKGSKSIDELKEYPLIEVLTDRRNYISHQELRRNNEENGKNLLYDTSKFLWGLNYLLALKKLSGEESSLYEAVKEKLKEWPVYLHNTKEQPVEIKVEPIKYEDPDFEDYWNEKEVSLPEAMFGPEEAEE